MGQFKGFFKNYRYITALIILSIVLLVPFALKMIDPKYEPYPSIMLPSGEWMAGKKNGNYTFKTYGLYGYDIVTGRLKQLNNREFLYPIPATYIYGLTSIDFGLKASKSSFFHRLLFDTTAENQTQLENERYRWLSQKLEGQGCKKTILIVNILSAQIDNTKHAIIKTQLLDKTIIHLPQ